MERFEHQDGDETYTISFTNGEIQMHRNNTYVYSFNEDDFADHVFVATSETEDAVAGAYIWKRDVVEKHGEDQYQDILYNLGRIGCTFVNLENASDGDMAAYNRRFGGEPVKYTPREITPRQERFIAYFKYLLEHDHITPQSFEMDVAL